MHTISISVAEDEADFTLQLVMHTFGYWSKKENTSVTQTLVSVYFLSGGKEIYPN